MVSFTLAQAAKACGGKYVGDKCILSQSVLGVTIDSRTVAPGFLFIPIHGERFDGHDFIKSAQENGALCCLSEKPLDGQNPYILVESALDAFQMIAAYYRSLFLIPAVAISGSAGKTTTKEMIAGVLAQKFIVLKNEGNLNNQTGVPLTIMRLEPVHQIAVIEMGMNHFGEIRNLSRIVRPKICVLTNIGEAHLEFLGSKEGILKAKSEMFEYMDPEGNIVINGDDTLLSVLSSRNPGVMTIGFGETNRIRAKDVRDLGLSGTRFNACYDGKDIPIHVPYPGAHMIMNALAALAVGMLMGVDARQVQAGIDNYEPTSGRMHV
ncbi:MAG: UDP-N-acetylmuramoyl-tripeptide--D-alanyl-D-alanine ligase, partial [Eubacteriales bacterium]|nr:UDP-N-acetylmuramoyl-tripeptide--D-alanyl-D-alanine ligase [Eubacteriales bacterium]